MWVEIMYASSDHDFKGKQLALHCRCGFAIDHGDEDNLVDGGAAREKELNNSESVQGSSELQWFLHTNIHSIFPYI